MYDGHMTLTRLTVNLTPRATEAMDTTAELLGLSKTDTVNRALQAYAFLEKIRAEGGEILIRRKEREELEVISFL